MAVRATRTPGIMLVVPPHTETPVDAQTSTWTNFIVERWWVRVEIKRKILKYLVLRKPNIKESECSV